MQLCVFCCLEKDKFQPGLDSVHVASSGMSAAASTFLVQPCGLPSSLAKGLYRCSISCCWTSFLCQCVWRHLSVSRRSFTIATPAFSRRMNRRSKRMQTTSRKFSLVSSTGSVLPPQNSNLLEKFYFNQILSMRTGSRMCLPRMRPPTMMPWTEPRRQ